MPKQFYMLDDAEKHTVSKMREGIKPLTLEDHEKILERAEVMFRAWARRARGQVVMPQDGLDYWVAIAAFEYALEQLGIKPHQ